MGGATRAKQSVSGDLTLGVFYPHPHPEQGTGAYLQANMGMVSPFWETFDSILKFIHQPSVSTFD